ncbi:MAG TPA: LysE/ArgO family amino acid transporter [Methylibium sp.]|uniref:LysE/ArgO family amino acid transporter n=1 Tax=Methylibium sp. TaxID=2067992 RepID=UPI002DBC7D7A|nr:LysE/ArgO family amino acid transporter [Methylibium sp.]HEU4460542.1 LysE/ArgO family amino acid transporter [Methylibium sp.]
MPAPSPSLDPAFFTAALQGALLMAGLIVAIGAQNLLLLRQGASGQPVAPLVAVCTASDWLLSALGVFGLGALVAAQPGLLEALRWGGVAFLAVYGGLAARRAQRGGLALAGGASKLATGSALLPVLAATWLNPHVYLDTVVLVGAVGAQHAGAARLHFLFGVGAASLAWFSLLGFGARSIAPWLRSPRVWRAIDASVALSMWALAWQLARTPLALPS